jgi:hypothetical protein
MALRASWHRASVRSLAQPGSAMATTIVAIAAVVVVVVAAAVCEIMFDIECQWCSQGW